MKHLSDEYLSYIASDAWAAKKRDFYSRHRKRCTACPATTEIQLHHVSYEHLGDEPDEDLMPLCVLHHVAVDRFKTSKTISTRKATELMLAWVASGEDYNFTYVTRLPPQRAPKKRGGNRRRHRSTRRKYEGSKKPSKRGQSGTDVLFGRQAQRRTDNGL